MKAFVTGATGLLGNNLVRALRAEGHAVRALVPSETKVRRLLGDAGGELVRGDMETLGLDPTTLRIAMRRTGTIAVTGAASGIGAATARRLMADGHRVITVDLRDADVTCDMGTDEGRRDAVAQVTRLANGVLDGLVQLAGVGGWRRRGALVVSMNYFGSVAVLEGLRPALARSGVAAVVLSIPSAAISARWPVELERLCLDSAEDQARKLADKIGAMRAYGASATALARYVRRHALTSEWFGVGIRLNAIVPGFIDPPLLGDDLNDKEIIQGLEHFRATTQTIAARIAFLLGPEARSLWRSAFVDGGVDAESRLDDGPAGGNLPAASRGARGRTVARTMAC